MALPTCLCRGLLGAACLAAVLPGCSSTQKMGYVDRSAAHPPAMDHKETVWNPFSSLFPKSNAPEAVARRELKQPSQVHLAYARWQEEVGQTADARNSYQFVLQEEPDAVDALLGLARIDQLAGRSQQAEQGLERALKLSPNSPHVLNAAGEFYAAEKRWPEAVDVLTQAVTAAPDEAVYRYHLAIALARSGDISAAMPHFVRSVGEAEAHYNVGYVLYEQGQLPASEEQFKLALSKRPELPEARSMLNQIRAERTATGSVAGSPKAGAGFEELASAPVDAVIQASAAPQAGGAAAVAPQGPQNALWTNPPQPNGNGLAQAIHQSPAAQYAPPPSMPVPMQGAMPSHIPQPPPGMTPQQLEQWRNQFEQE